MFDIPQLAEAKTPKEFLIYLRDACMVAAGECETWTAMEFGVISQTITDLLEDQLLFDQVRKMYREKYPGGQW